MVKKVREVIDLLEANGWKYDRMKGTYNSILRQAGLK